MQSVLNRKAITGRIAVLMGGNSAERDISLQSGDAVLDVLKNLDLDVVAIDPKNCCLPEALRAQNIAHVFIALHGRGGEDGSLQGCLEMMGISYTGSGVLASALAMDKMRCKQLWQGIALPTAEFARLDDDSDWQGLVNRLGETLMVKPVNEGSSIGMARTVGAQQLKQAYLNARQYDDLVIAERWIRGDEYTVAIVGGEVLPVIKLETDNVFYDYDAKYISNSTRYICPCGLSPALEKSLQELAWQAYNSLGCHGWGRVDAMMDEQQNPCLLEVNTVPGMTSHSLVPMAAKAAGYSFADLVSGIFNSSLENSGKKIAVEHA